MRVIDSHTEGEPTRVIIDGGPDLGSGTAAELLKRFAADADEFRRLAILEPRGSEAVVGALLCEPSDLSCVASVLFFNNTGYLGMCGHGAIGVAVTLAYLGRIGLGQHRFETPVGVVGIELLSPNEVRIGNVPSYRYRASASVETRNYGTIVGDIAWGGNWFFLVEQCSIDLELRNLRLLEDFTLEVRAALQEQGITGANSGEIDHVEVFGPGSEDADSRNFVLCPGGAHDRSPCGTGTSAKLACLAASGKLAPGEQWTQESIIGSRFVASYRPGAEAGVILPSISGRAFICGETTLVQQPHDPFAYGIQ